MIKKVTGITDDAGNLIAGLSQVVDKVNHGHGSIGRLLNNDKIAKDLEGTVAQAKTTVQQAKTTIANVHTTSSTLNEDLKAAQHNILLRGFFRKKQKAKRDSIKRAQDSIKKAKQDTAKSKH
jgi:phospholipid/cholesterol/gamma-HCH transport system substrate-binding protein